MHRINSSIDMNFQFPMGWSLKSNQKLGKKGKKNEKAGKGVVEKSFFEWKSQPKG